ncbi:MAG: hypothetical protein AB8A66_10055 [Prochlorococcus sp.]
MLGVLWGEIDVELPHPLLLRDPALLDFDPLLLHSLLILDLSQLTGCEQIATAMQVEREH